MRMGSPVVKGSAGRSLAEIGARGKRGPGHHFGTPGHARCSILSAMATQRRRRKTIFFPPRHKKLADIISIESPAAFRESIRKLKRMGIGATEKRALVLAQNRAKAMLKKRSLSAKERRELQAIARMRLPEVTKKAA